LIMNSYGNFVVQNGLKFSQDADRTMLSEKLQKLIPQLSDPKIKSKWINLL
jgi:hypothetical protein